MIDAEDTRTVPKTWREYLKESQETWRVGTWIWKELTTPGSRRLSKRFLIALIAVTILQLIQPLLLGYVFDGLVHRDLAFVYYGFITWTICATLQKVIHRYECRVREKVDGINLGAIEQRVTELVFQKSLGQHLQEGSALSAANIDKGRWRVAEMQKMLLFDGIPMLLGVAICYVLLWGICPVAGIVVTSIFCAYACWSLFLNQQVLQVCSPIDREYRRLNRRRVERWEKIERVKTNGREEEELQEMGQEFETIITADRTFWFWFLDHATGRGALCQVALLLIMAYGTWLVWEGVWLIGILYPLFNWSSRIVDNLWQISRLEHQLNWNMPAVRSMMDALSIPPSITNKPDAKNLCHTTPIGLSFKKVSYTYPEGTREEGDDDKKSEVSVIKNVTFTVEPGEKVALIGSSGAGKTTIMRLALRAMDPDEGEVRVNGYALTDVNHTSWMQRSGYIPQQAQIFDGTIRSNLLYGLPAEKQALVTDDELWRIMRLLHIDFGKRLTKGLDTVVGRNGVKLSGGQAQRLMIGAAVMKDPLFLIIDEATSSLDSTTEKGVQSGLAEVLSGSTSALVIAHRLSSVRELCTKFVVLRPATDVLDGESQVEAIASSFEVLYMISPTFRRLADDQAIAIETRINRIRTVDY